MIPNSHHKYFQKYTEPVFKLDPLTPPDPHGMINGYRRAIAMNEYVEQVVVDIPTKSFYLFSDLGDSKTIECDTTTEFMNILEVCNASLPDGMLTYTKV